MKEYIKGVLCGAIAMAVICAIPAVADTFQVAFNTVRINVDGVDKVSWGQSFVLDDGTSVPYSIVYNNTTYLPMRKMTEFAGRTTYWNGDTQTAAMTAPQKRDSQTILAEEPDLNGNIWTYYTFETTDGKYYLGVKDSARGYERVYRIQDKYVYMEEDSLYYIQPEPNYNFDSWYVYGSSEKVYKISFLNDSDTQDGEVVRTLYNVYGSYKFEGETVYYAYQTGGNASRGGVMAVNIKTGKYTRVGGPIWTRLNGYSIKSVNDNETIIEYSFYSFTASAIITGKVMLYKDEMRTEVLEEESIRSE